MHHHYRTVVVQIVILNQLVETVLIVILAHQRQYLMEFYSHTMIHLPVDPSMIVIQAYAMMQVMICGLW